QLTEFPVVTVLGPRQAGKTTLARTTLPHFKYVSLEDPDLRAFATDDPALSLKRTEVKLSLTRSNEPHICSATCKRSSTKGIVPGSLCSPALTSCNCERSFPNPWRGAPPFSTCCLCRWQNYEVTDCPAVTLRQKSILGSCPESERRRSGHTSLTRATFKLTLNETC